VRITELSMINYRAHALKRLPEDPVFARCPPSDLARDGGPPRLGIMLMSLRRPPELEIATAFLGVSQVPVQESLLTTESNQQ
jgi:hypothetical protein